MGLDELHRRLGWPAREQILRPHGVGASVRAQHARSKIGSGLAVTLRYRCPDTNIEIGVLASDAGAGDSAAPIAIVCEFSKPVPEQVIAEAHRLAWNFCRTPLLFVVEPTSVRVFTCCEQPSPKGAQDPFGELVPYRLGSHSGPSLSDAESALSWPSLIAGELYRRTPGRFRRAGCADATLLDNLTAVRQKLRDGGLPTDTAHDVLARLIFIQFLFDRKDSEGRSALNSKFLAKLHRAGQLRWAHDTLASVLSNRDDAYDLFKILDDRFNGDLFPAGADATPAEREAAWATEMAVVTEAHLSVLGQFVGGQLEIRKGQLSLWQLYSFDVIPLEFISSIYEQFVNTDRDDVRRGRLDDSEGSDGVAATKSGPIAAHYTPGHVVDLVLDSVLPWEGTEWNLRVLDPACGSGAFLVNVFRRLVHRWRSARPDMEPGAPDLRSLLERNLFGVDCDPHAVRVASFSLYLAMCDEIDPKYYWGQVKFPALRGRTIWQSDFFEDDVPGFCTTRNEGTYDLIVGNAPLGYDSITPAGEVWAARFGWRIANRNEGPLFVAKGMSLLSDTGRMAMIQPAELLFNQTDTFQEWRQRIFSQFTVEEVINLSALRFGTFKGAVGPSCVLVASKEHLIEGTILYSVPKPSHSPEDEFQIIVGPDDMHEVLQAEAVSDPAVWTSLMWGSRRDYALVRRLRGMTKVADLLAQNNVHARSGIKTHGPFRQDHQIVGRRIFRGGEFPDTGGFYLEADQSEIVDSPDVYRKDSTDYRAFEPVQLLIKLGWQASGRRFSARMVEPAEGDRGLLCTRSYYSVSASESLRPALESACAFLNSKFATYYLLMTSGRFAMYRPEPTTDDFLAIPVLDLGNELSDADDVAELDAIIAQALDLRVAEQCLVDETFDFTIPEFKGGASKATRQRFVSPPEPELLREYAVRFAAVLRAAFGPTATVAPTIYLPEAGSQFPVYLVGFRLNGADAKPSIERSNGSRLLAQLAEIAKVVDPTSLESVMRRRVLRVYSDRGGSKPEVDVFIVKPARLRFWTRSAAMRDADAVAADIMAAGRVKEITEGVHVA